MRTSWLLPAAMLAALSCQPKETSEQKTDTVTDETPAIATPQEVQTITQIQPAVARTTFHLPEHVENFEFDLVIFPLTQIFAEPNEESEVVMETETFMPLTIKSKADASKDLDVCEQFPWFQVEIPDQVTGWVKGGDVKIPYMDEAFKTSQFDFNEKTYAIRFLVDAGIGPSNEEGLTGCITTVTPYFYDKAENGWHFIKAFDSQLTDYPAGSMLMNCYPNYLGFTYSEGGSSEPGTLDIESESQTILWKVNISYQDGGGTAILRILLKDEGFELEGYEMEEAYSGD